MMANVSRPRPRHRALALVRGLALSIASHNTTCWQDTEKCGTFS